MRARGPGASLCLMHKERPTPERATTRFEKMGDMNSDMQSINGQRAWGMNALCVEGHPTLMHCHLVSRDERLEF